MRVEEIINFEQSQIDLQEIVDSQKTVNEKFTLALQRVYICKKGTETVSIRLDVVVKAMLACAEECGGQCYVSSRRRTI